MATYNSIIKSRRKTLTATTVDILNFVQHWTEFVVANEDTAEILTVTIDGTTPTAGGDDMYYIPAGSALPIPAHESTQVKVLGNGNVYSVIGL